jgi:hypothetical protein
MKVGLSMISEKQTMVRFVENSLIMDTLPGIASPSLPCMSIENIATMMAIETIAAYRSFVEELLPQTAIPSGDGAAISAIYESIATGLHTCCMNDVRRCRNKILSQ